MLRVTGLDHIVLAVADVERSVSFYHDVLGLPAERFEEWKQGKVSFPSMRINEGTLIDLVRANAPAERGERFENLAHFCLAADAETLEPFVEKLRGKGVAVHSGPAKRWGARGDAASVYFRDPDGNEIEVRTYSTAALERLQVKTATGS